LRKIKGKSLPKSKTSKDIKQQIKNENKLKDQNLIRKNPRQNVESKDYPKQVDVQRKKSSMQIK
jgi:hypothetical protein